MTVLRSTWQSSVIQALTDVQEWDQLTVGSSRYRPADFIWWQVVRRRWSTHLEQPTWCHPRFVFVILHIHKTVKILLFVCLTAAARMIFNWRLTNVLTNFATWDNSVAYLLPSPKEGGSVFTRVCSSVCLSGRLRKSLWTGFDQIFGGVGHGPRTKRLDFGGSSYRGSWIPLIMRIQGLLLRLL